MPSRLGPRARELSRPYYKDAFPAHDIFHAKRVRDVVHQLADQHRKSVDRDVLAAVAWFHDIGRPLERVGEIKDHDEWAATEAITLLEPEDASTERIAAIEHCLRVHSIRASSPEPETIEAKFLFDADKLDAAGAVGLVRLACIVGERSGHTGEQYAVIDDTSTLNVDSPELPDCVSGDGMVVARSSDCTNHHSRLSDHDHPSKEIFEARLDAKANGSVPV